MSDELVTYVKTLKTGDPVSKSILRAIAARAHSDTGECFPSVKRVAEEVEVSMRTVQRHLKQLETDGFIARITRFRDDGSQSSNGFTFPGYEAQPLSWRVPNKPETPASPPHDKMTGEGDEMSPGPMTLVSPHIFLTVDKTPVISNEITAPKTFDEGSGEAVKLKPQHILEAWNAEAERSGLKTCRVFNDDRQRKARTLIRRHSIDEITEAIAAVGRSSWCRGENPSGWRPGIDFIFTPAKFARLIEGSYDGK